MKILKNISLVLCLGLAGALLAPPARASAWNKKTIVSFNVPVEIPGMVLPAGKYVFKLADSQADRNIVQIFNADESHIYATILAIPDYRLEPTGKTVITFEERAANAPQAVRAWFYPGAMFGDEFVYPKVRAVQLAQANKQNVLSMPSEMAANITKPAKTMKEPSVTAMKNAPVKAVTPENKEMELAEVMPPKPVAQPQQAASKPMPTRLPQTGSDLPLVALIGLLSLGAGAGLRVALKENA